MWIVSLVLLLVAVILWLVSVCLWIAVGGVVGPQISSSNFLFIDTCDSKWQSNRDNLIIAAFVISLLLFVSVIAAIFVAICKKEKSQNTEVRMIMIIL